MHIDPLLPQALPIAVSAHLLGRSAVAVRELLRSGVLAAGPDGTGVCTASIQAFRSLPIAPVDYLAADRAADHLRRYHREAMRTRRANRKAA